MQSIQSHTGGSPNAAAMPSGKSIELAPGVVMPCLMMTFGRNEEVFSEEEEADYVYKVISGAVRAVRILSDGRRQISAFHLPGDVFGLECGAFHRQSAEAVVDSEIALVRRTVVERAAQADGAVARKLWTATSDDLQRMQDHLMRLGRECATRRVESFLAELSGRCRTGGRVNLPMGRLDIADYLGLTIETVSRTMTQLEREGSISIPSNRCVILHDSLARAA